MKSCFALFIILLMLPLSICAQDSTTKEVHADLQIALGKHVHQVDSKTLLRISITTGMIYGEYVVLSTLAVAEQGHLPDCIPDKPDMTHLLIDVSHTMEVDSSIDQEASAGILEALMSAYPCLMPKALMNRTTMSNP